MGKNASHDYFSAVLSQESITCAIYRRLCQWGGQVNKWFPASKVRILQEIVHDFARRDNLEDSVLNQLLGWECALGQIVDTPGFSYSPIKG